MNEKKKKGPDAVVLEISETHAANSPQRKRSGSSLKD
jgi:hypothetical protein